jgi:hypothetical protein
LARALERALTDQVLAQQLKAYGPERMRAFDLPTVVPVYEAVLERVLRRD